MTWSWCVKSVLLLRYKWKFEVALLLSAHPSSRKNYRHRQSAEAGAREGLTAANGAMHEVLQLVSRGEMLPEPTQTAAFSLNMTILKRRAVKMEEDEEEQQ